MTSETHIIPEHVPKELVREFNFISGPEVFIDPHHHAAIQHGSAPDIFWNPCVKRHDGRGVWQPIKAADIRSIMGQPDIFSSDNVTGLATLLEGANWRLIPVEIDPPMHAVFRQALNPLFSPAALKKLSAEIEARAENLINAVAKDDGCEFMAAFGRPFPVTIIMELIGLPLEELDTFLKWEYKMLHSHNFNERVEGVHAVHDYLKVLIDARIKSPKNDFVTIVTNLDIQGRKITKDEMMGICFLLFLGGLDTVASSLGFHYKHLAENQDQQQYLRKNPDKIPAAIEELIRRYAVVNTSRVATQDIEMKGVQIKKGDWIGISTPLACLDPDEFVNPMQVDFNREHIRPLAFAFGPHFCMGAHLARLEMRIAMAKWLTMVPDFSIKPNSYFEVHGGAVYGVEHLEIQW